MGKIKDKIKEFTEYTSIHGVGRLSASKGFWQRFLWSACLLGALGILFWQMSRLFQRFIEKPAILDIRVHVEELDFPAVAICNVNQFRRSKAARDKDLDAAIIKFEKALKSQLYSGSADNSGADDLFSTRTAPKARRRKREVFWNSFEETYEEIAVGSSNFVEDEESYYDTLYHGGAGVDDKEDDGIPEVHIRKKRGAPEQNTTTSTSPITDDEATTSGSAYHPTNYGPEVSTATRETTVEEKTDTPQAITAQSAPGATAVENNYISTNSTENATRNAATTAANAPKNDSTSSPENDTTRGSTYHPTNYTLEVSTTTGETTQEETTDTRPAITAPLSPGATAAENNYSPADDYYDPYVNLTGKHWFTSVSDNALVASSENLSRIVARMDLKTRRDYGHQIINFIQECTYNGETCSPMNFKGLNHHRYGNCYTFNAGVNQTILKSSKPGPLYGFMITLYIEQQEYVAALSPAAGVRVLIHSQDVQPFPEEEGIDISPGQKTTISMRMSSVDRLRYPYKSNCSDGTGQEILYNKHYSVSACLRSCSQRHKMDECKCGDASLPIVGKTPVCNDTNQLECIRKVDRWLKIGQVKCHCPLRCRENFYSTTISASDWPGEKFEELLKEQFSRRDTMLREALKNHTMRDNFLKIEVYFKELIYHKLTEVPAYELENLLGDIGGQLGLWIGMSILTLIEVIEIVIKLCNIFAKKQASVGTQTATP